MSSWHIVFVTVVFLKSHNNATVIAKILDKHMHYFSATHYDF